MMSTIPTVTRLALMVLRRSAGETQGIGANWIATMMGWRASRIVEGDQVSKENGEGQWSARDSGTLAALHPQL